MFVHGYNTQSDMARFLCRRERDLSFKQFRSSLLKTEALDPENFSVTDITLAEQHYLFVSSEHAFKRMRIRGAFNMYETLERCVELLQNPLIIPYISNYHVSMDDDDRIVENEAGYRTIAVIDDKSGMVFIFQAGYQFVRLVSVWNLRDGMFMAKPFTKVIELMQGITPHGFLETRPNLMRNVIFLKEDIRKHPRKGKGSR